MRRLMVMVVTGAIALPVAGCSAASAYKFNCDEQVCEVETSGPATMDFEQEYGETVEVLETADNRITLRVGPDQKTFASGESGTLGPVKVDVKNIKGEQAFFTLSE